MSPNDEKEDENNNNFIVNDEHSIYRERSTIAIAEEKEEKTKVYHGIQDANNVILNFVNNTQQID